MTQPPTFLIGQLKSLFSKRCYRNMQALNSALIDLDQTHRVNASPSTSEI